MAVDHSGFTAVARGVRNGVNIVVDGSAIVRGVTGGVALSVAGLAAFGNLVLVKHEGGWTAYAYLNVSVEEGHITVGTSRQRIGSVGMTMG